MDDWDKLVNSIRDEVLGQSKDNEEWFVGDNLSSILISFRQKNLTPEWLNK